MLTAKAHPQFPWWRQAAMAPPNVGMVRVDGALFVVDMERGTATATSPQGEVLFDVPPDWFDFGGVDPAPWLADVDRCSPMRAPRPAVGQVWRIPHGEIWEEALVTNVVPYNGGVIVLMGRAPLVAFEHGAHDWPPPGAVLLAGPHVPLGESASGPSGPWAPPLPWPVS